MIRRKLNLYLALCLITGLWILSSVMAVAQPVTATGRDRSRDGAIAQAVQKAVLQIADEKIGEVPPNSTPGRAKDAIIAKAGVWVPDPRIISESEESGLTIVEVEVQTEEVLFRIFKDESVMEDVLFKMQDPKIMVFVLDYLESGTDNIQPGNAETQIAKILSENSKLTIVSRSFAELDELKKLADQKISGGVTDGVQFSPNEKAMIVRQAAKVNAQYIIHGSCSYSGNPLWKLGVNAQGFNVKANLNAELTETATSRLITSQTSRDNKTRTTALEAAQMAAELAADDITKHLVAGLMDRWLSNLVDEQSYTIDIHGDVPLRGLLELQTFFSNLSGVSDVRRDQTGVRSTTRFTVKYPGDILYLVSDNGLDQKIQLKNGVLSNVDLTDAGLRFDYTPGQSEEKVVDATQLQSNRNPMLGGNRQQEEQLPDIGTIDIEQNLPKYASLNLNAVAVIIGNRRYKAEGKGIPNVEYAHRDAELMKRYLVDVMGYDEGNIIMIKDATYADMANMFGTERVPNGKLANMVKPGQSDVFVYYSGHGAPDADTKSGYLVPVNADPNNIKINGYPTDVLYDNLNITGAIKTTVVLDACFSGAAGNGEMLIKSASPLSIQVQNQATVLENGHIFTASSGDQIASWYDDKQHGLFTYQFLKGLKGAADSDSNGKVSISEMRKYLTDTTEGVPYMARRLFNREQEPQVFTDEASEILVNYDQ